MKSPTALVLVVAAVVLGFGAAQVRGQTRWRYKVLSTMQVMGIAQRPGVPEPPASSPQDLLGSLMSKALAGDLQQETERTLNRLGAEGYELCAVSEGFYIFKKQIR